MNIIIWKQIVPKCLFHALDASPLEVSHLSHLHHKIQLEAFDSKELRIVSMCT